MLSSPHGSKNLFKSNTIQAQEDISLAGLKADDIKTKLCVKLGRFFNDFSGLVNSFGLSSFVEQGIVMGHQWIPVGGSRKSI